MVLCKFCIKPLMKRDVDFVKTGQTCFDKNG